MWIEVTKDYNIFHIHNITYTDTHIQIEDRRIKGSRKTLYQTIWDLYFTHRRLRWSIHGFYYYTYTYTYNNLFMTFNFKSSFTGSMHMHCMCSWFKGVYISLHMNKIEEDYRIHFLVILLAFKPEISPYGDAYKYDQ